MPEPAGARGALAVGWSALLIGGGGGAVVMVCIGILLRVTCQRSWEHGRNRAALCHVLIALPTVDVAALVLVVAGIAGAVTAVVCGVVALVRSGTRRARLVVAWLLVSSLLYLAIAAAQTARLFAIDLLLPSLFASAALTAAAALAAWLAITGTIAVLVAGSRREDVGAARA